MRKAHLWIAVADGEHARILERSGAKLAMVHEMTSVNAGKLSHDLKSDKPGRSFQSVGGARSSIEPHTDPERHEKELFADLVIAFLAEHRDRFEQLALVAPAKTLGDLRKKIERFKLTIVAEVVKDLTHVGLTELPAHLQDIPGL